MSKISVKKTGEGGYPYNTLKTCLGLGEVIRDHGGGELPKSVIASALKSSEAGMYQLASSAKTFGIAEGTRDLKLTEAGHDYFFPTRDDSERTALLTFIKSPPVFAKLIDRFDGKRLPGANLLSNLMQRECGVPASWSSRVANLFIKTLSDHGLIDSGGFLRYEAGLHHMNRQQPNGGAALDAAKLLLDEQDTDDEPKQPNAQESTSKASSVRRDVGAAVGVNVWQFTEAGGTVRLETPDPLPKALWERLKRYVEVLEPGGDT